MTDHQTVRYRIDAKRSRFVVQAFVTGVLSAFAHSPTIALRDFTGEAEFAPGTLEKASLRLTVNAASLESVDDLGTRERQEIERITRDEVIETSRYPQITFESYEITGNNITGGMYRVEIAGELSLHGIKGKCAIDAQVWVAPDTLRANGEFLLRQSDYGIKPISAAAIFSMSGGTIKLKDEMKFSFDIIARAHEP
jgi:polyisoprenoid-binding protein YceI